MMTTPGTRKLRLRARIVLSYSFPVILFILLAVLVDRTVEKVRTNEVAATKLDQLRLTNLAVSKMIGADRGYLLSKEARYVQAFNEAESEFHRLTTAMQEGEGDPHQAKVLENMVDQGTQIAAIGRLFLVLVDENKLSIALEQFKVGEIPSLSQEMLRSLTGLQETQRKILDESLAGTAGALSFLSFGIWGSTVLLALLVFAVGSWLAARISNPIKESLNSLTTSSAEIASTVDEHERVVSHQAAAVNETTTTVEELGVSASQSAVQAESAAEAARQALEVTQDGIELANQVSASMLEMKHKVGSVAEQILRLSEQAGQIGSIARVVGEIAGETNMLALNAAVEAARAGEHGKGFAVVAAEVRKLADQSKKSAERANVLVNEIQKATNAAVMVTEQGSQTTEDVSAMMGRTIAAFGTISSNANSVSVSAQQVLMNSRQQASALAQVTEAMKSLAAGAAQMAAGTEQTKRGVQKLDDAAGGLRAMV